MRGLKIATVALCAIVLVGSFAGAQSLRAISGPSELPPPGFKSDQYVDSRGCVFIRAGYGGVDTWVPRVGNNRKPVCGQKASVTAAATAPAVAAKPVIAAKPAPVAKVPVAPAVVAAKPAPVAPLVIAAKPAAVAAAVPQVVVPTARVPARATVPAASYLPARVASATPAPAAPSGRMKVQLVANQAQCPGPVEATAERQLSDGRRVVGCGATRGGTPVYLIVASRKPAAVQPVAAAPVRVAAVAPARPAPVTGVAAPAQCGGLNRINQLYLVDDGRLVVKCGKGSTYLVVGRADLTGSIVGQGGSATAPAPAVKVPSGYKLAWNDGRLSTTRGSQSAAGEAAMRLVWTDDTPRRLIDRTSGNDVTMDFAYLDYPFTSVAEQQAGTARMSAMNAPKAAAATPVSGRFVQVGSFGVAENAAKAAASLQAAGLPVQISSLTRNGKSLQIVLAGPFATAQALTDGLARSRASGFADAFARN